MHSDGLSLRLPALTPSLKLARVMHRVRPCWEWVQERCRLTSGPDLLPAQPQFGEWAGLTQVTGLGLLMGLFHGLIYHMLFERKTIEVMCAHYTRTCKLAK